MCIPLEVQLVRLSDVRLEDTYDNKLSKNHRTAISTMQRPRIMETCLLTKTGSLFHMYKYVVLYLDFRRVTLECLVQESPEGSSVLNHIMCFHLFAKGLGL